jgi:hypothetical protein
LALKKDFTPVFLEAYRLGYVLWVVLEAKIINLINITFSGISALEPMSDSSYHMVVNYKATLNPMNKLGHSSFPRMEDFFLIILLAMKCLMSLTWQQQEINLYHVCQLLTVNN